MLTSTSVFGDGRISTHADPTSTTFRYITVARALSESCYFGFLVKQSFPKYEIPCFGRRWITVQNVTPLALSSVKKSVTVKKHTQHTHKQ